MQDKPSPERQDRDPVRSLQEGWTQVEPPSPGAPPAFIDRGPLCQQHANVGRVPPTTGLMTLSRLLRVLVRQTKRILPAGLDDWVGGGAGARSLVTRPGSGIMSPWDPRATSHASRSTDCRRCPSTRSPTPSPSRGSSAGRRPGPALRATGATTNTHRSPAGPARPCCGCSGGAPRIPTPHPEA